MRVDINALVINPDHLLEYPEEGSISVNSYKKALDLASKKYERKDASTSLSSSCKNLIYLSNSFIQKEEYQLAYEGLALVLDMNPIIIENYGEAPILSEEVMNHKYAAAICAYNAKMNTEALIRFKELIDSNYSDPNIYVKYFSLSNKDKEAMTILEKGMGKFPDDEKILSSIIHFHIKKEEYEILKSKIQEALTKEPKNPNIPSSIGLVYSKLFEQELTQNNNSGKANSYYNESLKYFKKAQEINFDHMNSIEGIGSLYFKKAQNLISIQQTLGNTLDNKSKIAALEIEINQLIENALQHFKKAESLNPGDIQILTILIEIFTRKSDTKTVNELKVRKEIVLNGGMIETSYFKK